MAFATLVSARLETGRRIGSNLISPALAKRLIRTCAPVRPAAMDAQWKVCAAERPVQGSAGIVARPGTAITYREQDPKEGP